MAEGNSDNQIVAGEFEAWRTHFGQIIIISSGAIANTNVAKAVTAVLLMLMTAVLCLWRGPAA